LRWRNDSAVPSTYHPIDGQAIVSLCPYGRNITMTYVITEPCINVKDTSCVDVCPMDCIHPRKDEPGYAEALQLYIDPEDCIDCGACVPECPVNAIYHEDDVPDEYREYIVKNAEGYK
jgi:NAD-dependent dihydropyrimidine dehydrogenase PreA subunit